MVAQFRHRRAGRSRWELNSKGTHATASQYPEASQKKAQKSLVQINADASFYLLFFSTKKNEANACSTVRPSFVGCICRFPSRMV